MRSIETTTTKLQLKKNEVQQTSHDYKNNCTEPQSRHWSHRTRMDSSRDHKCKKPAVRNMFARETTTLSAENGRWESLDLCLNLIIKLLVVLVFSHLEEATKISRTKHHKGCSSAHTDHHHQASPLDPHGSAQVLSAESSIAKVASWV